MDSKIVESTVEPVRSQFGLGYITSYKSNLERLETEVQNLEATKTNVQNFVDEAKRKGEVIVNVVQIWLKKVDATIAEAKKLIHNDENKYYMRYFPNLRFRHHQSKKSQKMRQEIHEVLAEGNFEKISYYKQSMLEEIQQVLKDPNIYRIGLYGIDGVGKTTLVKDLARQVEKDRSFDAVVMAEVTDSPDMENIQGQIANALGLKLDEETTEGRVGQLMHAVVRDMAKAIASRTHLTYEVLKFTQMEQWDRDQLQKCHYVNLPSYNMDELPEKLDCPKLKLMSLRRNHGYLTIPDNFFSGMREVKVLNLHGMRFAPSPPPSLHLLTNLISLNLYGCVLEDIAIVAELTRLEILTLERSEIQELPKEIGQLVYLRMLNLTNCYQLKTIPTNLLSSLTSLEELYMGNLAKALVKLQNLRIAYCPKLEDIFVQEEKVAMPNLETLELSYLNARNIWDGNLPVQFYNRNFSLAVNDCHSLQSLFSSSVARALDKLQHLKILKCHELVEIFVHEEKVTFPELETLVINEMNHLNSIWHNQQDPNSFCKLNKIQIIGCVALYYVFPIVVAKGLRQLQVLEISTSNIENIIEKSDSQVVKSVYLENLIVSKCDRLNTILQSSVLFQTLYTLEVSWCAEVIDIMTPLRTTNMPTLRILNISKCHKLEQVFGKKIIEGEAPGEITFMKLEELKLEDLSRLTSFFKESLEGLKLEDLSTLTNLFKGNLKGLKLEDLSRLTNFFKGSLEGLKLEDLDLSGVTNFFKESYNFNFPSLRRVQVIKCPNMKTFLGHRSLTKGEQPVAVALFNEKVAMPKLEILELSDINSSKIWDDKLPAHFYCQNLRILIVRGCDRFVSCDYAILGGSLQSFVKESSESGARVFVHLFCPSPHLRGKESYN
ncbi:Disease resistance protein RPS2 [Spatholobus suberectus]|nr:Disease resistance protein RPS2 [Spatholobus suberectus]